MSDKDRLRQTLAELHQELSTVELRDPEVRRALERALGDISSSLEQGQRPADAGAPAQLRAAARQFEVDHPALASTLEGLVDALARMGI